MTYSIPSNAYVIIIGAMKAGTTTLFEMLAEHPSICPSKVKEPAYFVKHQGVEVNRYEDLFPYDAQQHTVCLEASTSYTKVPMIKGVPKRMQSYGLKPYFIYSVRDPVDRIESDYNYAHFHEKPWAKDEILNPDAIYRSMYYMQLSSFLEYYPDKSKFLIVKFDDIITQPVELARRIFKWVGLRDYEISVPEPKNVTTAPSVMEMRLKNIVSNSYRKFIPKSFKNSFRKILRNKDSKANKKVLTDMQKVKLREQLRSDMEHLEKDFDVNIREWGF